MKLKTLFRVSILIMLISFVCIQTVQAVDEQVVLNLNVGAGNGWNLNKIHPGATGTSSVFIAWEANCSGYLTKLGFYGARQLLTENDFVAIRVYAVDGTAGTDGKPTGDPLWSQYFPATAFTPFYTIHNLTLSGDFVITEGESYCIALEAYNGTWDATHYLRLYYTNSANCPITNGLWYKDGAYVVSANLEGKMIVTVDLDYVAPTPTPSPSLNPSQAHHDLSDSFTLIASLIASLWIIALMVHTIFILGGGEADLRKLLTVASTYIVLMILFLAFAYALLQM